MRVKRTSKNCKACDAEFFSPLRNPNAYAISLSVWNKRQFCGYKCANLYNRPTMIAKRTGHCTDKMLRANRKIAAKKIGTKRPDITGERNYNWKGGVSKVQGYYTFLSKRRQVHKVANGGSHTLEQWESMKAKYQFMCLCCKRQEPEIVLTEDHIMPLTKSGTDNIDNIQPLCRSCNSRKHDKHIDYISSYQVMKTV